MKLAFYAAATPQSRFKLRTTSRQQLAPYTVKLASDTREFRAALRLRVAGTANEAAA